MCKKLILAYHHFTNEKVSPRSKLYIDEKRFRSHLDALLTSMRFSNNLNSLLDTDYDTVHLTIDDAYRNVYEIAFPILKEYGITATLFVPTSKIGRTCYEPDYRTSQTYCTIQQLKEMRDSGIIHIESHGHRHIHLGRHSFQDQYTDIYQSIEILNKYGFISQHICYPYGSFDSYTLRIVKDLGFKSGCTTITGSNDLTTDQHLLERYAPHSEMNGRELVKELSLL